MSQKITDCCSLKIIPLINASSVMLVKFEYILHVLYYIVYSCVVNAYVKLV